jgi:hypothetical protein
VVGGAVDKFLEPVASNHVAVVNEDSPDLNADEEEHVEVLLHGAEIDENTTRVRRASIGGKARLTGKGEIGRSRQQGGKQWQPRE